MIYLEYCVAPQSQLLCTHLLMRNFCGASRYIHEGENKYYLDGDNVKNHTKKIKSPSFPNTVKTQKSHPSCTVFMEIWHGPWHDDELLYSHCCKCCTLCCLSHIWIGRPLRSTELCDEIKYLSRSEN